MPYSTFASQTNNAPESVSSSRTEQALTIIRQEHRSLGMVLNEMRRVVSDARTTHSAFDCTPLKAMLGYIRNFPDKLHHPKEDAYLFARLSQRTHEADDTIAELKQHHVSGEAVMEKLEDSLRQFEAGVPQAFDAFCAEFDSYCEAQWQHMRLEENIMLPAAEKYLSQDDWAEIAEAFGKNGDPRFGPEPDKAFQNMYFRIMHGASAATEA